MPGWELQLSIFYVIVYNDIIMGVKGRIGLTVTEDD